MKIRTVHHNLLIRKFADMVDNVKAEAFYAAVNPPVDHFIKFLADFRILPVEIRLFFGELMHIELIKLRNPLPDGAAETGSQVVRRASFLAVPPYIVIMIRIIFAFQSFLEPVMFIGGVIQYQIHDDTDAMLFGFRDQAVHIFQTSEDRVNILVVGDVVAVIILWRTINRGEPDGVNTQVFQVVQTADDSRDIADTVSVGILKTLRINLIDDCFFPPFVVHMYNPFCCSYFFISTFLYYRRENM